MTAKTTAPVSHTQTITAPKISSAIFPKDFHKKTGERDEFTAGQMRHIIHALMGVKVAVTASEHGQVLINVELRKLRQTPGYGTFQVLISDPYVPERGTWTSLSNIKVIIPLTARETGRSVKWDVLASLRDEEMAATAKLRKELAGTPCSYGAYRATPGHAHVDVSYTPQNDAAGNVPARARYTLGELYQP